MGGNCVSTSYSTKEPAPEPATPAQTPTTDKPGQISKNGKGWGHDTSMCPDDPGYPPDSPGAEKELEWDGLQMGMNEHGSYMVLDKEEPELYNPPSRLRDENETEENGLCKRCKDSFERSFRPCLAKHNRLSQNPTCCQRFRYMFLCPPHGVLSRWLTLGLIAFLIWAVLWSITGSETLPGGNLFGLYVLIVCCFMGGWLIAKIYLPPLLGMLIAGFLLKNIPVINVAADIYPSWSMALRNIALVVILVKAGIGINATALKRLSGVCFRLAVFPCTLEACLVAAMAYGIIDFAWDWAFMLGFVIAAVSPAVVVPSMLLLQEKGYGTRKGIPTLAIASASCENVYAISAHGIVLGISFSTGNLIFNIFRGPLEMIIGVTFGVVAGLILWYIPDVKQSAIAWKRFLLVLCGGLFALFGSKVIEFPGAGALGCLILAFVAAQGWQRNKEPVKKLVGIVWIFFEPILFGLIGAEVTLEYLNPSLIGFGILIIGVGVTFRVAIAGISVQWAGLNFKERLFIALAWLPKATVQAAIGGIALDEARRLGAGEEAERQGEQLLTLAVLSIVITAPIGAIAIALGGPKFLQKSSGESDSGITEDHLSAAGSKKDVEACKEADAELQSPVEEKQGNSQENGKALTSEGDGQKSDQATEV
ncbi:sodium/hydrogen exchanger 9B2-like [Amphiura filiformis]|uniref:sodium/hydrogen exchanger 9B2-like n=1 Tax=Amphiura filiformis TaxID=82378 RepID=UPI003B215547